MERSVEIVLFAARVLLSEIHSLCFLIVIESINCKISPCLIFGMYVNPHMRTISLCVRGLPICEFFWIPAHSHMGTPRMRMGTSFWCGIDASEILSWVTRELKNFGCKCAHTGTHQHQKTGIVGRSRQFHIYFRATPPRRPIVRRPLLLLAIVVRHVYHCPHEAGEESQRVLVIPALKGCFGGSQSADNRPLYGRA